MSGEARDPHLWDWVIAELDARLVLARLVAASDGWLDFQIDDVARESVGESLVTDLLKAAAGVAMRCNVLGQSDGDGGGGRWIDALDKAMRDQLAAHGRSARGAARSPEARNRVAVPTDLRAWIMARDGLMCVSCDATTDLTVDHIVPVIRGGSNDPRNLQTLCRSCNSRKGAR